MVPVPIHDSDILDPHDVRESGDPTFVVGLVVYGREAPFVGRGDDRVVPHDKTIRDIPMCPDDRLFICSITIDEVYGTVHLRNGGHGTSVIRSRDPQWSVG